MACIIGSLTESPNTCVHYSSTYCGSRNVDAALRLDTLTDNKNAGKYGDLPNTNNTESGGKRQS